MVRLALAQSNGPRIYPQAFLLSQVYNRVMILSSKVVVQTVNQDDRSRFVKELVALGSDTPLAMVRKRAATGQGDPGGCLAPVLLIHGYGQNRYAWHLPSRSMVNYLACAGYDVFNLDLRGHGRSAHLGAKRPLSPAEYVRDDVPQAVEEILRITHAPAVFLVGHSLGGLISYASASHLGSAVAGVVSIGSPYHFTYGAKGLAAIAKVIHHVEDKVKLIEGDMAMELHLVGELVRSMRLFVDSPLYPLPFRGYAPENIEKDVLAQHMSLAMDMGSIVIMKQMFRWAQKQGNNPNVPGGIEGYGEAFEALTDLPLLVIAGSRDDLAPPEGVKTAYDRSMSNDKTYRCLPAGHIDLLVGMDSPQTTWPIVETWLRRRLRSQHVPLN
jgi:polyhydroxyalkanoate synthase subunit PhaC